MRFKLIDAAKKDFPVQRLCQVLDWTCIGKVESSLLIEEEPHAASETLYTGVPR